MAAVSKPVDTRPVRGTLLRVDPEAIDERLLEHLAVEFADSGIRVVEFLRTAWALLKTDLTDAPPRLAESIAYCLREAMKEIPSSQKVGGGGAWRSASRTVADARQRFERARGLPGEDEEGALGELLRSIDELELVQAQEGIHERRLIAIMVRRTGALPMAGGTTPIRTYQELLRQLDQALHGQVSLAEAGALWIQCSAILRQLFLPPTMRHAELEALAQVEPIRSESIAELLTLLASPSHLRHFLGCLTSVAWLDALTETGVLDPPRNGEGWPGFAAIDRLGAEHAGALSNWLSHLYERHPADTPTGWAVARATVDLGEVGAPLLTRIVVDHSSEPSIVNLGLWAAEKLDANGGQIEALADVLLNESSWAAVAYADPLIDRFVGGTDATNCARRMRLLCWKLRQGSADAGSRRWFEYERAGSIADWSDDVHSDRFTVLLQALVGVLRRAVAWIPAAEILTIVDSLPEDLRGRVRAWVLSIAPSVPIDNLADEVAKAIEIRDPTGDDVALLDRIADGSLGDEFASRWAEALGSPPTIVELANRLASHSSEAGWMRAFHWVGVLPSAATGDWTQAAAVIASAYGTPNRATLEQRLEVVTGSGQSPYSAVDLSALSVPDACSLIALWRPNPAEWLTSARELARTLEQVVGADPRTWLASPVTVATTLRHPTYIHHYLQGVEEAAKTGVFPPLAEILDLIGVVQAQPWPAEVLGSDDFDYDKNWSGALRTAVDVVKALADKDAGFAGRDDEVWSMLEHAARDRQERSGLVSGARDALDSAINRPCTRALDAVLSFMAYEVRSSGTTRLAAFALLEDALRLEGIDGAEHRAIVVTRLAFLRHVAADWVDDVAPLLFGDDAPDGLAQVAADLAIKWSRPNRWFFERYRHLIRDAVIRDVDSALEKLVIAMLWDVPGYAVQDNIGYLKNTPARLSKAGVNRPGESGDFKPWEGWSHVRENIEEVPA
jgi:hypothetical protein